MDGKGDIVSGSCLLCMIKYEIVERKGGIMGAIERLTITLPVEMAGLVKGAVDEGDYASASEVI